MFENSNISDKASAIYNIAYSLGNIFGPMVGGVLYDRKGFEFAFLIMAITAGVFAVFHLTAFLPCAKLESK